jgi:hypothetical protein
VEILETIDLYYEVSNDHSEGMHLIHSKAAAAKWWKNDSKEKMYINDQ